MSDNDAVSLVHSWNRVVPGLAEILVESDIRDALQSTSVRHPTTSDRLALLDLESEVGIDLSFVGFPATSPAAEERCCAIVRYIAERRLRPRPVLMARAVSTDLESIARIRDLTDVNVLVDLYIPVSQLRLQIEEWELQKLILDLVDTGREAKSLGLDVRVAFEDSTRATPLVMEEAVRASLELAPDSIVLNDTTGDCIPSGAYSHVAFVARLLDSLGSSVDLAWHGHNDRGLALANALAAVEAGAKVVSGTVLGVGERVGNIPLEQMIALAAHQGNERFNLALIPELCAAHAAALAVVVPPGAPIVGRDAFSTATGTHASAIAKARALGGSFEHLVYSAVDARIFGRAQEIFVGPQSGRAGAKEALLRAGLPFDEDAVNLVLDRCRGRSMVVRSSNELVEMLADVGA